MSGCRGTGVVPVRDPEDRRYYNSNHDQPCPGCPDCEPCPTCGSDDPAEFAEGFRIGPDYCPDSFQVAGS